MKKVAIFGKPGSGKSTLSKKLAAVTGINLHALDSIEYRVDGTRVERAEYDKAHQRILSSDSWIIDGFGPIESFYQRLEAADTLVYVDLPYPTSYWLVTKRMLKGFFVTPEGWPEGCSVLKGSMQSYKTLKLCPKFWNDKFVEQLNGIGQNKTVHVIRSVAELNNFYKDKRPSTS